MSIKKPRLKEPKINLKNIGKQCSANSESIVFSFAFMTDNKLFNFHFFDKRKSEMFNAYNSFMKKLADLSQKNWNDLNTCSHKKGGDETLPVDIMNDSFVKSLKHVSQTKNYMSLDLERNIGCS